MGSAVTNFVSSVMAVAMVTAIAARGQGLSQVINASGSAFAQVITAATGTKAK